ncbi:hypothetical protein KPH14_000776, partial [Odynerus spinipes]
MERNPNDFTVVQLKAQLRKKNLSASGLKNELIVRFMEADPTGAWMDEEITEAENEHGEGQPPLGEENLLLLNEDVQRLRIGQHSPQ